MRQDIDRLMQQRGLAGLVVIAADRYTSAMYYVTGQKLHHAAYFRSASGRAHRGHHARRDVENTAGELKNFSVSRKRLTQDGSVQLGRTRRQRVFCAAGPCF